MPRRPEDVPTPGTQEQQPPGCAPPADRLSEACGFRVESAPPAGDPDRGSVGTFQTGPPDPPRRVLLVEDHRDSLEALALLLSRRGMIVYKATSLAEALTQAEKGFDVLLSDLALPDGTGHELLGRLRRRLGDVPAVALSGFGTAPDVEASRRAGFHEHLTKPKSVETIVAALERALG